MHLLSSTVVCTVWVPGPRSLGPARVRRRSPEIANGGSLELPPLTLLTCTYLCVSDVTLAR
nr:MAG TPA: hypothetical protein [Caudoviricetes sp.]